MFIPVKAKETKQQQIENELDIFPTIPVLTLCANPKKGTKMLKINRKAAEVLGLKVNTNNDRLSIVRGYDSDNASEEKMFLYLTDKEDVEYVNEKHNNVKRNSSKVNLSTLRFKSVWMYDDLENFHSDENFLEDRYFVLTDNHEGYFRLEDMNLPDDNNDIVITRSEVEEKEIDSLFETKGKNADVVIHQD
jgi:hypothetical protein